MLSTYNVSGHQFSLEIKDSVFTPTSTTRKMAEHVEILEGVDVLDLGCGSGPLAILAALMGAGRVYAVDVMPAAVALTEENAMRNGLQDKVIARCGSLFEPVQGLTFDVIIDDVSGVANEVARMSPWFPPAIPTGGDDGADLVIDVLRQSIDYLKPGGKIYFPVLSLSADWRITDAAKEIFGDSTRQLAVYSIPFIAELYDNMARLEELKAERIIDYQKRGSRYVWTLEVWVAQRPL